MIYRLTASSYKLQSCGIYVYRSHPGINMVCSGCYVMTSQHRNTLCITHYNDIIMSMMASQITRVSIVCSTICWGADQRKHQSFTSLTFVREIHQWLVDSPHKGPVTWKMFPFDDIIMWPFVMECHKLLKQLFKKQSSCRLFEMPCWPWDVTVMFYFYSEMTIQCWKNSKLITETEMLPFLMESSSLAVPKFFNSEMEFDGIFTTGAKNGK